MIELQDALASTAIIFGVIGFFGWMAFISFFVEDFLDSPIAKAVGISAVTLTVITLALAVVAIWIPVFA